MDGALAKLREPGADSVAILRRERANLYPATIRESRDVDFEDGSHGTIMTRCVIGAN